MEIPDLRLRPELLAAGFTDGEVQRLRRAGVLSPIRRGAYLPGGDPRLADPVARHALLVRSTVPRAAWNSVVSHISAAVLHGLPVWGVPLSRVHVTRDGSGGGRVDHCLHVHVAPLDAEEVVEIDGIAVTSLARTVVDLARSVGFEEAVVVADAALARSDPPDLEEALDRAAGWRGAPAARRAVAFADGRSGSVGESRSRIAIAAAGLPPPVLQLEIRAARGRLVGYTDFGWPAYRTVGEFDGQIKYGRLLRPGQEPGDAVFAEKVREDRIRASGLTVVRWTWSEIPRFEAVAERLRRAFEVR
jgi:hypothetical protein